MAIDWHGDTFLRAIERESQARLSAAAGYLAKQLKAKVSRPNPTGTNPSLPGEPPKKVTGTLQTSITVEIIDEFNMQITCVGYGVALDQGTRTIAARPWIGSTVQEEIRNVQDVIAGDVGPLARGLFG